MHLYFEYLCIGLFFGMLLSQIVAYQYGKWRGEATLGMGGSTVETAIFALMGLMIAFTFAGAQGRYEYRRQLIVDEINAVKTTSFRLTLLPKEQRKEVDEFFSDFLKKRVDYSSVHTFAEGETNIDETLAIESKLWESVVQDTDTKDETAIRRLILPSLNDLFSIVNKRAMAAYTHTSTWIFFMFMIIAIICSILSGFRMAKQSAFSWSYAVIFSFTITLTMFVILDFEYPRRGFIRLEIFESTLVEKEKGLIQQFGS